MKRMIILLSGFLCIATASQAQLVDKKRQAIQKQLEKLPESLPIKNTQEVKKVAVNGKEKVGIEDLLKIGGRVSSPSEGVYDSNRDGMLKDKEMKEFLNDVFVYVERLGKFKVTSNNILKNFDDNKDGEISRIEAGVMRSWSE